MKAVKPIRNEAVIREVEKQLRKCVHICEIFQCCSPEFYRKAHEEMYNSATAAKYNQYKLKGTGHGTVTGEKVIVWMPTQLCGLTE